MLGKDHNEWIVIAFRKGMFTRLTICTRLPFQSWPTSSSRWDQIRTLQESVAIDIFDLLLVERHKGKLFSFHQNYLRKASPWPEAEDVAPYVNDDPIFLNLYRCHFIGVFIILKMYHRELYFRHIYARVQVTTLLSIWISPSTCPNLHPTFWPN